MRDGPGHRVPEAQLCLTIAAPYKQRPLRNGGGRVTRQTHGRHVAAEIDGLGPVAVLPMAKPQLPAAAGPPHVQHAVRDGPPVEAPQRHGGHLAWQPHALRCVHGERRVPEPPLPVLVVPPCVQHTQQTVVRGSSCCGGTACKRGRTRGAQN